MAGASPDKAAASDGSTELAVLRGRCARLEELAEYRRELLVESGARTQMLIAELAAAQRISEALARSLPLAPEPKTFPADRAPVCSGGSGRGQADILELHQALKA